jgi:transcriptional regulator with PAS, ATPase and Fis domain
MEVFKSHIFQEPSTHAETSAGPVGKGKTCVTFSESLPTLKQIEDLLVEEAMKRACDNQSIAALALGISRQALNKRLKKMNQSS